jgi:hypothetical protein
MAGTVTGQLAAALSWLDGEDSLAVRVAKYRPGTLPI